MLQGNSWRELERLGNQILTITEDWLQTYNLQLSTNKCKVIHFNKRNNETNKRPPQLKIKGATIKKYCQINLLGVTITKNLTWFNHIKYLQNKLNIINSSVHKVSRNKWGVPSVMLKLWYKVVVEKIATYAAGAWAVNLTKQEGLKLDSLQRPFLLRIARAYRTTSTAALNIMTGLLPLHLATKEENLIASALRLRKSIILDGVTIDPMEILTKEKVLFQHPADFQSFQIRKTNPPKTEAVTTIYTDGSKSQLGTGYAFFASRSHKVQHESLVHISAYNTVFQAEISAIQDSITWAIDNQIKIVHIYTDSLSSLLALNTFTQRNPLVQKVLQYLQTADQQGIHIRLHWIPAHTGIQGNERVDKLAKRATAPETPTTKTIQLPISYVKKKIRRHVDQNWQTEWDQSDKGRRAHHFLPKANRQFLIKGPAMTSFVSGHGPYLQYLYRFKRATTPFCSCGKLGSPNHYYSECPLTTAWHVQEPTIRNASIWIESATKSKIILTKMKNLHSWLLDKTEELQITTPLLGTLQN